MSGIQHSPAGRRPIQGMREALEHGVSVFAAIAMPAKGGQGSRVGGVVGAGEATFNGEICQSSIFQAGSCHRQHPPGLGLVARFGLELADADQIIERGQAHGHLQSMEEWAAPGRDSQMNRVRHDGAQIRPGCSRLD